LLFKFHKMFDFVVENSTQVEQDNTYTISEGVKKFDEFWSQFLSTYGCLKKK